MTGEGKRFTNEREKAAAEVRGSGFDMKVSGETCRVKTGFFCSFTDALKLLMIGYCKNSIMDVTRNVCFKSQI